MLSGSGTAATPSAQAVASGIAVTALGHSHPHLVKALTEQAQKIWHTSNIYQMPGQEKLAQRLIASGKLRINADTERNFVRLGVGQNETDIMRHASVVILLQTPMGGGSRSRYWAQMLADISQRTLLQLLDTLDDDRRSVYVLAELEGLTAQEIADGLRLNINTVYSRLRAARAQLERALGEREGT